ncbi:hypothetical protein [Blastochloris sulfoviridis]|uniref:Uncharacterized protein n=1 Tax=Blastochloris sulfoviridis TaxID=50712 RepID=A0A5M6I1K4_9HYPH|nr:hypothetical protein [Blastochloris sulfoviridis]KAA5602071.1 hypothetical protein F1193_06770 [Blastochloris sulfoviridis]
MRVSLAAIVALPLAVLAGGPAVADWTPVQLGPGGPIIEQDWGLYRPGHGSPRILDGPILMPVPRPIGMPEPLRVHYEMFYARRGFVQGVPPNDGIVRKDTPPSTRSGAVEQGWVGQVWSEPRWQHYFPGGVEPGDQPAPKPASAPKPAEPFFRVWTTPTMPDVQPTPPYQGPDVIYAPQAGPPGPPGPPGPRPPGPRPR